MLSAGINKGHIPGTGLLDNALRVPLCHSDALTGSAADESDTSVMLTVILSELNDKT